MNRACFLLFGLAFWACFWTCSNDVANSFTESLTRRPSSPSHNISTVPAQWRQRDQRRKVRATRGAVHHVYHAHQHQGSQQVLLPTRKNAT
ncbi:hypothetical protein EDD36DRAFT_178190 [Exophiala viscosa]|uniref:Secreted protein n=1 Tax=Exophiala viscosa TaxID=2486360 RepID=A0AAN6DYW2_9EURO|nr:hypothetical protein EDD36DRAFT_178190 [Exophiala viscosa]